jgi:hypothetical protein
MLWRARQALKRDDGDSTMALSESKGSFGRLPDTPLGATGAGTSPTLFAGSNVATTPVAAALGSVATALTNTGSGLANTLGLAQVLSNLGLVTAVPALSPDSSSDTTTVTPSTIPAVVSSVTSTVSSTVKALLGHS